MDSKDFKISICVVCMNRLHHLKQTLIKNIHDNADYQKLEFVLLDYNSEDGLNEWVKRELNTFIENGRLRYYRIGGIATWNPSHSKNIAFKLATGDIICNIWADYYTGLNFAAYVNQTFIEDENIVLTPIDFYKTRKNYSPPSDVLGKVCVRKSDFLRVGGFDEKIDKHGFEDYDFINRLEMTGVKRVLIENPTFLEYVAHDDSERYILPLEQLYGVFVSHLTPHSSDLLILFNDYSFYRGIIVNNSTLGSENPKYALVKRNFIFEYTILNADWDTGEWKRKESEFEFFSINTGESYLLASDKTNQPLILHNPEGSDFFALDNQEQIANILEFKHFYDTRKIMENNLRNSVIKVNPNGFGQGVFALQP